MALRVGVVTGGFPTTLGGTWTFVNLLETGLRTCSTGHQFIILDKAAPAGATGERPANVTYLAAPDLSQRAKTQIAKCARHFLPTSIRRGIGFFRASHRDRLPLRAAIKAAKPDIVWFLFPHPYPVDIPYISTVHDLEHRKQPWFPEITVGGFDWAAREAGYGSVLPRASFIVVGTEVGKQEIIRFYGVDAPNIRVIPFPAPSIDNATPSDLGVLRKFGITGDFIFYPAQLTPCKNHFNLLQAIDILRTAHGISINLVLSGGDRGNRRYILKVIDQLGLTAQVLLVGYISRDEVKALCQRARALVFPSFFGPDNLPPLEAFAWRCPVAASDIPGAKEQLGDGALFFRPTDPADIAVKIAQILTDEALRRRLIAVGSAIAAERTPRAYVGKIIDLLDEFEPLRRSWGTEDYKFTW